jgi:putative ABC transport system permease protein
MPRRQKSKIKNPQSAVILGVLGAVAVARLMKSLLFQTAAYDPLLFLGVALGLSAIALLASFVPALRATRSDPVSALHSE